MSSRRYAGSDASDYYRDRDYRPRRGEERYYEEDVEFRRRLPSRDPPRERETLVREEVRRERSPPAFLREDYGRTSAGPIVLRSREREEFEFVPRPRRRSPSPPSPERKVKTEEIIIRGNDERRRSPSPVREREEVIIRRGDREFERRRSPTPVREREEVIIRRGDREFDRRHSPSREREEVIIRRSDREVERRRSPSPSREREEVIIRRSEREPERRPARREEYEREEVIIDKRGGRYRDEVDREEVIIRDGGRTRAGSTVIDYDRDEVVSRRGDRYPREVEREEVIISRNKDRESRYERPSRVEEFVASRAISRERQRSRSRSRSRDRVDSKEIVIRRDERDRGGREREEIIIRNDRDRSASSSPSSRAPTTIEKDRVIRAPDIHQNVITHHRHVYHDDMDIVRPRPITPPSPPPPPPAAPKEEETIEIRRRTERNGRAVDEDIIINNRETNVEPSPAPLVRRPAREDYPPSEYRPPIYDPPPPRRYPVDPRDERDIREEAEFYNHRALERSYPGEGYHGATRDWALVDVPPGTRRVRMDGAGGGAQEITWQRFNGVRRSKFMPEGTASDDGYGTELGRPILGGRFHGVKDSREGLWTEITKDLVVKEALEEAGYEYEETDDFYYVIAYLKYDDIARLVGLSEDIRHSRRRRIKEMDWERRALPAPVEERRETLLIEEGPRRDIRPWDREAEVYREREVVVRGGRPYR